MNNVINIDATDWLKMGISITYYGTKNSRMPYSEALLLSPKDWQRLAKHYSKTCGNEMRNRLDAPYKLCYVTRVTPTYCCITVLTAGGLTTTLA